MEKIKALKKHITKRTVVAVLLLIAVVAGALYILYPPVEPGDSSRAEKATGRATLEHFDKNNALKPDATPAEKYKYYADRTSYLNGAGDYENAISEFKKAEATGHPVSYQLYAEVGVAYERIDDKANARASYEKSIAAAEQQLDGVSEKQVLVGLRYNLEQVQ